MAAKIIAVANMKGGVGKTTVVVSLAETLAMEGREGGPARVLVIDLDAQANASFSLAGDSVLLELIQSGRTIDAFLEDRIVMGLNRTMSELVRHEVGALPTSGEGGVSLIAASPELRIAEREIIVYLSRKGHALRQVELDVAALLNEGLEALREQFDFIIFDCAPGISALTEAALRAADQVIVPTVPDFISNLGLEAFCKTVQIADAGAQGKTPIVLANRVRQTPMQSRILEEMRAESHALDAGFAMFQTEIPERTEMEEATAWSGRRQAYGAKYGEDVAEVLRRLALEV